MSAVEITCLCGDLLRAGANFCARCGREMRQLCPLCFEERRLSARFAWTSSPWCEKRGELMVACRRCGRWLPAGTEQCPDPGCGGQVSATWPATTGRSPNGAGTAGAWRWPAEWDRQNPAYRAPLCTAWSSSEPVHAAFTAHGRLYVWAGTALVAPPAPFGGPLANRATSDGSAWRCWLGFDGQPEPTTAYGARVELFGGGAILATTSDFAIAGLYPGRPNEAVKLEAGQPISHVAAQSFWAGWARGAGGAKLWCARVNSQWRNTECRPVKGVDQSAAPRSGSKMLMHAGVCYWVSECGDAWQLDCSSLAVRKLAAGASDTPKNVVPGWCGPEGLHLVLVDGDGIRVGLDGADSAGVMREAPGGAGPLRDIFAAGGILAVAGDSVVTIDSGTGYVLGGGKYVGQWIAGTLAEPQEAAKDKEPRLLMLTLDETDGNLSSLRPSSGGEEAVWRGAGIKPAGLIPTRDALYVVHEAGVICISTASGAGGAQG